MLGELGTQEIDEVLRTEVIGRIGCHARGRTYVVPVTYVYDGASLFGHTGLGQKVVMMRENPIVCFEVEQLRDLPSWRSVIVYGRYEELHGDAADAALQLLVDRLQKMHLTGTAAPGHGAGRWRPGEDPRVRHASVLYAIRIHEKTGRYERISPPAAGPR